MSETVAEISLRSTGHPALLDAPAPKAFWSSLASAALGVTASVLDIRATEREETVFLDRAQQRILRRSLRRSVTIIA